MSGKSFRYARGYRFCTGAGLSGNRCCNMWGNLSKLNLCTYHPVHCQALYTALRGTITVLRQLSAAPELPLDEHLVTRFHIGIAPKQSFFRDSGSVWDFFCVTFVPSIFHRFQFGESPCSGPIFRPHLCSTSLCCSQRRS